MKNNINIITLALVKDILNQKIDVIEGFRDLQLLYYDIYDELSDQDKYFNFIRGFCDQTEEFPRGATRKLYAADYLSRLDQEEREYLNESKQEINKFLLDIKQFLEQGGDLRKKVWD